jgi:hypothetical protein
MHRVNGSLAAFLIAGLALAAPAALAEPSDLKDLAKNPQNFLGPSLTLRSSSE